MVDWLTAHAAKQPEKLAVVDDRPGGPTRCLTYTELNARASRLATHLRQLGLTPEEKVGWCGQNSIGLVVVVAAVAKAGAVAVPLNYQFTARELAYVVEHSDARIVCVDEERAGLVAGIRSGLSHVRDVVVFDADGGVVGAASQDLCSPPTAPHEGAYRVADIFYTSGTTGRPKGAVRDRAAPQQSSALAARLGMQPDDVYLTTGPMYHSGPSRFLRMAQALGNTVVVQYKFDAEDWLRLVDTYRVSSTFSAPTPIRMVCALPAATKACYDRSSMRRFIANAAPWPPSLKRRYLEEFHADSLWEVYGSAETGVVTVLDPKDQLRKPGSCGRPAPGVEVKLVDDQGIEVTGPDQPGDLYVRSEGMFTDYYKAHDQYEADRRGDYHTVGDIAQRDDEGYYYIVGRKRELIISGGMNVYPAEVEAVLEQSPDIFEAAVLGLPDELWGERVHAFVVPTRDGVKAAEVVSHAREHLAGYKVPRQVTFVDELPKTGSGKVRKQDLVVTCAPRTGEG